MVNRNGLSAHTLTYTDLYTISDSFQSGKRALFKNLSETLKMMFNQRNKAYYEYSEITLKDAKKSIENAKKIINNLKL